MFVAECGFQLILNVELVSEFVPLGGFFPHAFLRDLDKVIRCVGVEFLDGSGVLFLDLLNKLPLDSRNERQVPGDHTVEDDTRGPDLTRQFGMSIYLLVWHVEERSGF